MKYLIFAVLIFSGCSKPLILDQKIKAHWMDYNGTKGIWISDYTYIKLREKLIGCEK